MNAVITCGDLVVETSGIIHLYFSLLSVTSTKESSSSVMSSCDQKIFFAFSASVQTCLKSWK